MARRIWAVVACTLLASTAFAQNRTLTIDDLYDPQKRIDFSGGAPTGLAWISDTHYVWPKPAERGLVDWIKADAVSGTTAPLFDAARMRAAFDALPGLRAEDVARLANQRELEFNPEHTAVVVSIADDLYYYQFGQERAVRLTFDPYQEEEFAFSPDARQVSFVRRNNLYVVNVEQQRQERQLTTSGSEQILNGKLDWIYQEEIYGRGNYRGYWWSPDSSHLAFLQLDENPVPEFTIVDHIPTRQTVAITDYPKAGDPNPRVKLGVVAAVGGHVQWVDLTKYDPIDFLVVDVSWTPNSKQIAYQVQNREQFWLDLNVVETTGAGPTTLLRETASMKPVAGSTFQEPSVATLAAMCTASSSMGRDSLASHKRRRYASSQFQSRVCALYRRLERREHPSASPRAQGRRHRSPRTSRESHSAACRVQIVDA